MDRLLDVKRFTYIIIQSQVFYYGFRSSRKFQKKLYVWDLLEKVHEYLLSGETTTHTSSDVAALLVSGPSVGDTQRRRGSAGLPSPDPETQCKQMFLNAISRINTNNTSIGKDEKVCLLLTLNYAGFIYIMRVF